MNHQERLPRLAPEAYLSFAAVHWTMTMEKRASGLLDPLLHARLREALVHAGVRGATVCLGYCFLPDRAHFLVLGIAARSNQRALARLLRREWNRLLPGGLALQKQAYDHVLRADERERGAFARTAQYILENPVRAGIVAVAADWPCSGSLVPGYPSLNPQDGKFRESFWLAREAVRERP